MCGIVGCISKEVSEAVLIRARDALVRRGPDDAGYFSDDSFGLKLGHRRLSIIDLSAAGHQPMCTPDGRYVVVFNGEIYNYLELREELKWDYSFRTATDTEVILAAFSKWKCGCVEKFNGMFAIALYDRNEKMLHCFRDRLGIKPFYYFADRRIFAFASEIKSLLALGFRFEANDSMVYDYLAHGHYDHTDETFFKGIKKLPAGFRMSVSMEKKLTVSKYWDLDEPTFDYDGVSYEGLQEQFKSLLEDSIRLRFRSDLPVGVNVSSGIDSTSLLFFAEKITKNPLNLFSICMPDRIYDEGPFIKRILNDEQKGRWHTSSIEPDEIFTMAETMNGIQDEPYGGIPTIAYAKLNQQAQENGVVVLLEGQGVDEILAGYSYFKVEYLRDLLRMRRFLELGRHCHFLWSSDVPGMDSFCSVFSSSQIETSIRSQDMTKQIAANVLSEDFIATFKSERQPLHINKFKSELLNAQYRDIRHTKLPRVLRFNDHITMHYSRELRVPYLDYRLVEFSFFLPDKYKIDLGVHKRILRDAMRSIVPKEINCNEKVAFGAIQTHWFRKYFKDEILNRLGSKIFRELPYFDHVAVLRMANRFFEGEGNNSFFIWQWLNLIMWFNRYMGV